MSLPFVALNGELIGESADHIIEVLREKFANDTEVNLTAEQLAVHHSLLRMVNATLYPSLMRLNFVENKEVMAHLGRTLYEVPLWLANIGLGCYKCHLMEKQKEGVGKLSDEQFQREFIRDLQCIEGILASGEKEFLFGSQPTIADCAVYPQLALMLQLQGHTKNTAPLGYIRNSTILQGYIKRCEASLFPDLAELAPTNLGDQAFNMELP